MLDVGRRGGMAVLKRKTVLLSTGSTGEGLSAESRSHGTEVPEPVEAFRIQVTERENERWRFTAAWDCTSEGGWWFSCTDFFKKRDNNGADQRVATGGNVAKDERG